MKKQLLSLLFLLTLCVPAAFADSWVETAITDLATGDVVVIVDKTSSCAMGTMVSKGPSAVKLTLSDGKATFSDSDGIYKFNVIVDGSNYLFRVDSDKYLYCIDSTTGVRIGTTTTANVFTWDSSSNKLKNTAVKRWLGVYNSQDWRCYSPATQANIKATVTAFYKLVTGSEVTKEENGLAWSDESYDYTMGEVLEAPTLVNPNNLTVAYSSSDGTVATIDAAGVLEIQGEGSTTITATFEGDDTYKAGRVSYELTVIDPNAPLSDEITVAKLGLSGTSYQDFNEVSIDSNAKYSGAAASNNGIQINTGKKGTGTKNYCGIYTVKSAGLLKSISITFHSNNSDKNAVKILASNSPFDPTVDYSNQSAITIAELNKTTSKYIFEDDYTYFAIISASGANYITSIDVEWAEDVPQVATPTYEFINYLNFEYADIKLACETEGVTYKYTINGGEEQSTDGIIRINEYGTYEVTLWAEKDGMRASKKITETIVYKNPFAMSFSLEPGEYPYGTEVKVLIDTDDAGNYSTFDYEIEYSNSTESKKGVNFDDLKFTLTESCTITVKLTYKYDNSIQEVLTGEFTVSAPEAPKFSKDGGLVLAGTEVTLTAAEGMTIYYTTDGTEPTNESTLYAAPIVVNDDMTIRAVAYIGTLASKVAEASFDVQNSLAEINALAGGDTVLYSGELTVVYASGAYNYVYDGTNYSLLYQDLGLQANDVIKAGWSGAVSYYNGLYEIKDVKSIETVADATPLKAVPVEVRRNDFDQIVTKENMNLYVEIKNIEITNLDTKKNFTSAFGTLYNQLSCEDYSEAGHYDVVGFVGYYEKGTTKTVQIFPSSMTLLEDPMIKVFWHNHNGTTSINWNAPHVHYSLDGETFEEPVKMTPSQTAMAIKAYAAEATATNDWEAEIPAKSTHVFFTNNGDESKKTQANEAVDGKHYTPTNDDVTGIENITVENAAVEYFNLQGVRVANPSEGGIYIMRQGSKTSKIRF